MRDDASEASYSSWGEGGGQGQAPNMADGQLFGASAVELSKELNRQITQASTIQELMHVALVNFNKLNAVRARLVALAKAPGSLMATQRNKRSCARAPAVQRCKSNAA